MAGDKEAAAAEAEWRQLTHLIEHDRKQTVRQLSPQPQSSRFCPNSVHHAILLQPQSCATHCTRYNAFIIALHLRQGMSQCSREHPSELQQAGWKSA